MYESYADVLESYIIAEEGLMNKIGNAGKFIFKPLLKLIAWLREKVNLLIRKFKDKKNVVSQKDLFENVKSSNEENDEMKNENDRLRKENDQLREENKKHQDTITEYKQCLILSSKIAGHIAEIDKSVSRIRRDISILIQITKVRDMSKLEDLMEDVTSARDKLISDNSISELYELIRSYFEIGPRVASIHLKGAATSCLINLNEAINDMENVIKKFENSTPIETDDEFIKKRYIYLKDASEVILENLKDAYTQVNKISSLTDDKVIWVS